MAIRSYEGKPGEGMALNSNIEVGVYEDADFHRDFAAAMRKAVCTPPAENSNPSGASDGAAGQGVCALKRGCTVRKGGVDYRVRSVNGRVVQLETFDGSFAFFSAVSVCRVVA